jgi:hypothetical protein
MTTLPTRIFYFPTEGTKESTDESGVPSCLPFPCSIREDQFFNTILNAFFQRTAALHKVWNAAWNLIRLRNQHREDHHEEGDCFA